MPEPDPGDARETDRRRALLSVERTLRRHLGGSLQRLDGSEIRSSYSPVRRRFTDGWRFKVAFSDGTTRRLDLLVSAGFPALPPRAALVDRPDHLTWPHIEHDGILCLLNNLSEIDPNEPGAVSLNIVNRAVRLVEELLDGEIVERDFREEFLTYWFYGSDDSAKDVVTLFDPPAQSRLLHAYRHEAIVYVGECNDSLARWIGHRFGEKVSRRVHKHSEPVAYIWLSQPPLPSEYPKNGGDLMALAEREGAREVRLLKEAALHDGAKFLCLFGAEGRGGPGIAPVHVDRSDPARGFGRRDETRIHRGFRNGKTPDKVKLLKTFGQTLVRKSQVARADGPWVHGRGQDGRSRVVSGTSVTVLGCGSVGSFVVADLVRAGVGTLNVVDFDILSWANVGRHVLGATSVGENKAVALARKLQSDYPHLEINGFDRGASDVIDGDLRHLLDVDLIVSAMGDWAAESALDRWHRQAGREIPVVYGWTEDHALSGSAVVVAEGGGCLASGLNRVGAPLVPVTLWPDQQALNTEPACADHYRPYGAIELSGTTSMVSAVALDELLQPSPTSYRKVWIGRLETLGSLGGELNQCLVDAVDADIRGTQSFRTAWPTVCDADDAKSDRATPDAIVKAPEPVA